MASHSDRFGPGASPETRPRDTSDLRRESDGDAALSGWDPYIVAITGGGVTEMGHPAAGPAAPAESRELGLLAWLREHGA